MRIVTDHARTAAGNVIVHVVAPDVAAVWVVLPGDHRDPSELLQRLLDELPAAVDRALGVES